MSDTVEYPEDAKVGMLIPVCTDEKMVYIELETMIDMKFRKIGHVVNSCESRYARR